MSRPNPSCHPTAPRFPPAPPCELAVRAGACPRVHAGLREREEREERARERERERGGGGGGLRADGGE